jgi:hypothetical protein
MGPSGTCASWKASTAEFLTPPIWLDVDGRLLPTRPCHRCGAETPIHRMALVDVKRNGWRPYRPAVYVHWCGHGIEVIPWPDEDGMCDLVPVLGEISVEAAEALVG